MCIGSPKQSGGYGREGSIVKGKGTDYLGKIFYSEGKKKHMLTTDNTHLGQAFQ